MLVVVTRAATPTETPSAVKKDRTGVRLILLTADARIANDSMSAPSDNDSS